MIEVELKVKGINQSEDKYLSFLSQPVTVSTTSRNVYYFPSKRSSLMFLLSKVAYSVEATIFVRVIEGSWPTGVAGSIVVTPCHFLLKFGADKVPVGGDGHVELSRHVISVGVNKELKISYNDSRPFEEIVIFEAAKYGRSYTILDIGACRMEVYVVWSVVSPELNVPWILVPDHPKYPPARAAVDRHNASLQEFLWVHQSLPTSIGL